MPLPINDIMNFLAVANERSFTRAAARLGVSQSALSHSVRALEAHLGVRLLTRTTRSVSMTEAGERLLGSVGTRLQEIESELGAIRELGDKVSGTIRITAIDHVVDSVVWPRVEPLLHRHPDLRIEISTDYRLVDIVAERYDIGVRWGDQVEKDMVAVRMTAEQPLAIAASPAYLAAHGVPRTPQDLLRHNCITLRLASSGGIYAWELANEGRRTEAKVAGQAVFTSVYPMLQAALSGHGLVFLTADLVQRHVEAGRLALVMPEWCPLFPGLHAYYTSRRNPTRALTSVIEALREPRTPAGAAGRQLS